MEERINTWLNAKRYTKADKEGIIAALEEAGVDGGVTMETKCGDCWHDAVFMLAMHYGVRNGEPKEENQVRYIIRG